MPVVIEPLDYELNRIVDIGDKKQVIGSYDGIIDIVSEKISPDFGECLNAILSELKSKATEFELLMDADTRHIESENEYQRGKFMEINETIDDYLTKLDSGEQKFSRKRVIPILQNIQQICEENT